jgi:hypothetical protein
VRGNRKVGRFPFAPVLGRPSRTVSILTAKQIETVSSSKRRLVMSSILPIEQILEVLCEDCHIAKGIEYVDDCRQSHTQLPACEMRDILRLERWCLLLSLRPPKTKVEVEYWGSGVRAVQKNHRKRWRAFVRFCFIEQMTYVEARRMRLCDFLKTSQAHSVKFSKFTFGKKPEDFVFDIGGCLFPPSIYSLLADDQQEVPHEL